MTDRRRINGPPGGTAPPIYSTASGKVVAKQPVRTRKPNELRKIFLKTGLVPSASGSAYLELEDPQRTRGKDLVPTSSSLKLTCSVFGPKPLSRNASFSPNLQLTANVKFAPFATRLRRGYIRDSGERDLGTHLETALKGAFIPNRWPKSGIEVIVTVLEGEDDYWWENDSDGNTLIEGAGIMNVLAGCMTVASAALADARIDCLDLLAGGTAAIVSTPKPKMGRVLDPCPSEHKELTAACVVGYMPVRDEITELWIKGDLSVHEDGLSPGVESLIDSAVTAARGAQLVLQEAVKESAEERVQRLQARGSMEVAKAHGTNEIRPTT